MKVLLLSLNLCMAALNAIFLAGNLARGYSVLAGISGAAVFISLAAAMFVAWNIWQEGL